MCYSIIDKQLMVFLEILGFRPPESGLCLFHYNSWAEEVGEITAIQHPSSLSIGPYEGSQSLEVKYLFSGSLTSFNQRA